MILFLLRRLVNFLVTLFAVSIIVFAAMNVLPGDPALTILGLDATEDALEALRQRLGLNEPLTKRYFLWIGNALTGNFGISHSFSVPVSDLIIESLPLRFHSRFRVTYRDISFCSRCLCTANHKRYGDWGVMVISQLGIALYTFWLSILLVLLFAVKLRVAA